MTNIRAWAARALMGGAVLAAGWAMFLLGYPARPAGDGLPWLVAAVVCFAAAVVLEPPSAPPAPKLKPEAPFAPRRLVAAAGGVVFILWLTGLARTQSATNAVELALWTAGIGLFTVGVVPTSEFTAIFWRLAADFSRRSDLPTHFLRWLLLLGLTFAALVLRLVWLEEGLPVLFGDEAPFAVDAASVVKGARESIFQPGHQRHMWLFPVMQTPFIVLFGQTLAAVRVLPALVGALTVPAVYLLAQEAFGRRTAWAAAVFLAGYPVHIHFSRLGINNIFDPLFGTLALALLWRGLRTGQRLPFALAGAAWGLSQYFYSGGRLYLVLVGGYVLTLLFFRRGVGVDVVKRRWRGLLAMFGAGVLTVWPSFFLLYVEGEPFIYRAPFTSIFADNAGLSVWEAALARGEAGALTAQKIGDAFLGYIHTPDRFMFYGGTTAMLLPMTAVAFLLGLMWAAWRRRGADMAILAWVALTALLGGAAMKQNPGYARYVVATPALAALVGLGVVQTAAFFGKHRRFVVNVAIAMLALALAALNVTYYYGQHLEDLRDGLPPRAWQLRDLRARIAALPYGAQAHVISADMNLHGKLVIKYFDWGREMSYHDTVPDDWDLAPGEHAFFVYPEQQEDMAALMARLPGGRRAPAPALHVGQPYMMYRVRVE